jgi:hypothetical protein
VVSLLIRFGFKHPQNFPGGPRAGRRDPVLSDQTSLGRPPHPLRLNGLV